MKTKLEKIFHILAKDAIQKKKNQIQTKFGRKA